MKNRHAVAVVAGIVLVIGLFFAVLPVKVGDDISCGNAFTGANTTGTDLIDAINGYGSDLSDQCHSGISTRRAIGFPLLGLGAIALLYIALTGDWSTAATRLEGRSETEPQPERDSDTSDS